MSRKKDREPGGDEAALFRKAVGDVAPVRSRPLRRPAAPAARAVQRRAADREVLTERLADPPDDANVATGEELRFRRPGLAEKDFRRLRRGQFSIRAEIDLHGMTATEARRALRDFFAEARADNQRCVRVVHGKGLRSGRDGPVLKNLVNRELRRWDCVLAFCSAQPRHGGTGAVYVLLRRRR